MTKDDLEFQISQYTDGTLPPEQAAALEARLASDADARAMLLEHRRVNAILRDPRALPKINWDRLRESISSNIDHSEGVVRSPVYQFPMWGFARAAVALAACLAIGLLVYRGGSSESNRPALAKVVQIVGPVAEASAGTRIAEVTVVAPPIDATAFTAAPELFGESNMSILVAAGPQRPSADPFGAGF